ncbi:MAG: DUF72 domain-containing protein [Bacteroidota bacterium]
MEFGKLEAHELELLDLTLPADHKQTTAVLKKSKAKKTTFHIGCAKWGRPDWIGKIYPKGTKAANFLDEYAKQFNCIESNGFFYQLPTKTQIQTWLKKVPADFIFCPKFSGVITHNKRLKNIEPELNHFLDIINELGPQLGPVFLMPHPQMGAKHFDTIAAFMDAVPKDIEMMMEFRHTDWYANPQCDQMYELMEAKGRGSVITDAAGRRDCAHMRLTSSTAFIRFVGNSLHATDYQRIDDWVVRLKSWMEQGLENCYFFMHQHDELYSPELCKYLIVQLNEKCGQNIPVPRFVNDNQLF